MHFIDNSLGKIKDKKEEKKQKTLRGDTITAASQGR